VNTQYLMRHKWISLLIGVLLLMFLPGLVYIVFIMPNSISPEQGKLLTEVKGLVNKPVKSIDIEPFDLSTKRFRTEMVKPEDISTCLNFLKNADTKPIVGGHVKVLYACTLVFNTQGGQNYKVIAEVFSDKPLDARVSNNFFVGHKENRTYTRFYMKPLFVGGFGKWLINREPGGLLPLN